MGVGLFHLANPGQDIFDVRADHVLGSKRQAELKRITEALAGFEPTHVMVEWPAPRTDERYVLYRAGTLEPTRNEVVQLGFRLAERMELDRVHGTDVPRDFPFQAVKAFAEAKGRGSDPGTAMERAGASVQVLNERVVNGSLGAALRFVDTPDRAVDNHALCIDLMRLGDGDSQPGATFASAWYARNLGICARLLQALPPGGKGVVFYGEGTPTCCVAARSRRPAWNGWKRTSTCPTDRSRQMHPACRGLRCHGHA